MIIYSGDITKKIAFVALDTNGQRVSGLTGFTVKRSRNGGTQATMSTPTITEDASATGDYWLLVDEDTTIDAGDDAQEMRFVIQHASMVTVSRAIEIHRSVWNQLRASHASAGTFGEFVNLSPSLQIELTQEALDAIENEILDALAADHNTADTIGEKINAVDNIELNPVIDVEVIGGGPVEHEPVANANKRLLSRRADGTASLNRSWTQRANETVWHSVNCSSQLAGGHTLTGIAAPTVTGGGGNVTVGDYGVLGVDAKVRISTAALTAVGTTATIRLVLTPTVGAQIVVDCPFEVLA